MVKIKLTKQPKEVYFKKTTHYELDVDGKPLTICVEEDSNEAHIHYKHGLAWHESPPDWILEIGEDDWGDLIFERALWENLSGMDFNEEILIKDKE